ncbi:TonB-dependent receptor plug domain-containing protein [Aridibaculum aurantiacum]|uniref:TonB-dependent receptor plug domain-containing protein n=1 Tax=Aridibaculum aurantiacum TaxID=2810307 RepID=UPI001A9751DA|nr:TonB-dependent receptor plug domain-containing protein [Aridibaculum aurantiacum]
MKKLNARGRILNRVAILLQPNMLLKVLLLILVVAPVFSFAQLQSVAGIVRDEDGKPVSGVSVTVKSANRGTSTDETGRYTLELRDPRAVLVFSNVGYEAREVSVAGKAVVDVVLKRTLSSLDDVVVVGYGTTKRRDLIGSVGKANVEDMKKAPVPSFDQMLAGRIAGVTVSPVDGQPGGAASISIRGSSVSQETSPLFVIDGFPVENMDINSINPNDIESFEVLKDPSSIAIYGSRGGNGVILITTK